MQDKKQQLELNMEQWTGSKLGKEYDKSVYCHHSYLPYMQNAAAATKSIQLCPTLCGQMAAHQTPLSLGFSRQGHWNGLPFPSPMHESEKGK